MNYSQTMRDREVAAAERRQLYSSDLWKRVQETIAGGEWIKLNLNLNTKRSATP
jgi:hypothetical protein